MYISPTKLSMGSNMKFIDPTHHPSCFNYILDNKKTYIENVVPSSVIFFSDKNFHPPY